MMNKKMGLEIFPFFYHYEQQLIINMKSCGRYCHRFNFNIAFFFMLAIFIELCEGYPSGGPISSCYNMIPVHSDSSQRASVFQKTRRHSNTRACPFFTAPVYVKYNYLNCKTYEYNGLFLNVKYNVYFIILIGLHKY